jgi:hypothetical protein
VPQSKDLRLPLPLQLPLPPPPQKPSSQPTKPL